MSRSRLVVVLVLAHALSAGRASSQSPAGGGGRLEPDLAALAGSGGLRLVNRSARVLVEPGHRGVRLGAASGDGVAWVDGARFSTGTITLDVRGKDLQGRSFVGVAFDGLDDRTFEAVYVRPFNFRASAPLQKGHAVQYVAHPEFTWDRLREEHPEVYENPVSPVPDPNDWVRLRLEVRTDSVRVYVGEGAEPDLAVARLATTRGTRVGVWVGNGSAGDFSNLRLDPAPAAPRAPRGQPAGRPARERAGGRSGLDTATPTRESAVP